MSEDNEYQDADIVWVKLRSCWWPGEVCSQQRQPEGLLRNTKRKPYCVVKFFQEESFECVKNAKMIFPFNCSKKDEFIRKGHALLAKNKYMEQFPAAVSTAERLTRSVTRSSLFFNSRPDSIIKAVLTDSPPQSERIRNGRQCEIVDKILKTKPSATTDAISSCDLSPTYKCTMCDFQSTRQNVMVLHRRSHSGSGSRPQRNSFVGHTIISPTNTKGKQTPAEIIQVNDKASTIQMNSVMDSRPLIKKNDLASSIDSNNSRVEMESDIVKTNEDCNKNLARERPSKENNTSLATVSIRPPPKKQLNFINCNKSENIHKSLLADWIDEDKEDDVENEEGENIVEQIKAVDITSDVNKSIQYNSAVSLASTSVFASKLINQETSVAVTEKQNLTPTSKIRNIPKKDRRNIIFTEFSQSDDFSHVESLSQKTTSYVSSEKHLNEENVLCVPDKSAVEIPILGPATPELLVPEQHDTKTIAEELLITNMLTTASRDKAKSNYEKSSMFKPSTKKNKTTRHEAETIEVPVEVTPSDMKSFPVNNLQDNEELTSTTVVGTRTLSTTAQEYVIKPIMAVESVSENVKEDLSYECTLTPQDKTMAETIAEETTTAEAQTTELPMVTISEELTITESASALQTTEKASPLEFTMVTPIGKSRISVEQKLDEQNSEKQTLVEQSTYEPTKIPANEPSTVKLTTVEPTLINPATEESTQIESTTVEPATLEPTTKEPAIIEPTIVKLTTQETTAGEPNTPEPIEIESMTTVEQTQIESNTGGQTKFKHTTNLESSTIKCSTIESTRIQPARVESITGESAKEEPSTIESPKVEPITVQPSIVEPTIIELTTAKPSTEEPTAVEPTKVEPTTKEYPTEELTTIETPTVQPSTVEPITVKSTTVKPTTAEITSEDPTTLDTTTLGSTKVELTTVKPITVEPFTFEPTQEESATVELTTEEPTTVEPASEKPATVEPTAVEPPKIEPTTTLEPNKVKSSIVEPITDEATIPELITVQPSAMEPTIEKSTIVEPTTIEEKKVVLINTESISVEIATSVKTTTEEPTIAEFNSLKPTADDSTKTNPIKRKINTTLSTIIVPASTNQTNAEIINQDLVETRTIELKPAEPKEKESDLENQLQVKGDIIIAENQPLDQTSMVETSLNIKSSLITTEQNILEPYVSKLGPNLLQVNTVEPNKIEQNSLSKKQTKRKKSKTSAKKPVQVRSLISKNAPDDGKNSDETLKEKDCHVEPVFSGKKSSDEISKAKTSSKEKNITDLKQKLKVKKPTLRSPTPRGCKRDTFETKETLAKKETTGTPAKKVKLNEKSLHSSNEDTKTDSFTTDQSLSIQVQEEAKYDSETLSLKGHFENKLNTVESVVNETQVQIKSKTENPECSTTESTRVDDIINSVQPLESKSELEDAKIVSELNESKPRSSFTVQPLDSKSELEDAKIVSELNELKPRSSFSKASLACFDFNEEEDILTSIANFKKTYVSPEKSYNFGLDSRPKTPDAQKLELEMKDKQLSADIESLLKTTTLPVNLTSSKPLSNEVRGLPIKERGKRIFKSRNRFRVESCTSVSTTTTTTTTEAKSVSSSILSYNVNMLTPVEICDRTEPPLDIKNQESGEKNDTKISNAGGNVKDMESKGEHAIDGKETTSEEEIVRRIVFSPAEVYAPSKQEVLTESVQIVESAVSSSSTETNTNYLRVSDETANECPKNDDLSNVDNTKNMNCENPMVSPETKENDELKLNLEPFITEKVGDVNEDPEMIVKTSNQNNITASPDDLAKINNPENIPYTVESSMANEENIEYIDNGETLIKNQHEKLIEDNSNAYAEEMNEPDYGKEMFLSDEIGKADSNCESPFEYELVTTEVSTIVDHISNEEQNLENAKESSTELLEEVVSCCDDGTFLNEMIIADVIESQSSVAENETDNLSETLKYVGTEPVVIENPIDESNSSIIGINAQMYADEENDPKEERLQTDIEHAELSSDDSSTIISDAEAEFGSPTSMLDDERVLNRPISGGETPATNAEGKGYKTLKKSTRKTRNQLQNSLKENKRLIQSLQCDTQESTSNDVVNEIVYNANKYGNDVKECILESKLYCGENNSFRNKVIEHELTEHESCSQENNDILGKHENILPLNEKDTLDSNYENSDSSEEEEEEICSPPIEPLLDEDTEAETIENYSTTTSLSKSEIGPQVDCEVPIVDDIVQEFQIDHPENPKTENEISEEYNSEMTSTQTEGNEFVEDLNGKTSDSYYTITKKSDTIIKLNKHKEKSKTEKGWTETNVDVRKSELAGEELTAAEALLLIPNQATNIENSTELITKPQDSVDSLSEVKNLENLLAEEEIKEETLECNESTSTQDLELCDKGDVPKELIRRKRRSHMKVTPRKRVIDEGRSEEKPEESNIDVKVPKLSNVSKDPGLQLIKPSDNFEDSFVLKYMKESLTDEIDSFESIKGITIDSDKTSSNLAEKQTLEKVHITVDISNPLSSQIATILGTNRPSSTEAPLRSGVKKRKMSVEDDIPSFIIKRPCPKTIAEEEAADRETIAQIQNLCPQVEITRKSSKDDQNTSMQTSQQAKPQIINQQILRAGNNQPLITVTAKCSKPEEGIFDISNMPIVLSNEKIINEKVHLVITPTTNPQIIKQLQNQHQLASNTGTSSSNFSGNSSANVTKAGIPVRRTSCVRTKRTPSRQQLPEQQIPETQNFEQENYQQQINIQQQPNQQQEYIHPNPQLQQQHQIQQDHNQLQLQRQNPQGQMQTHNQFQQQFQQQQFQHHQNQIQQQLQEEQNILMQHHHQLLMQQQLQLQQQLQSQQQLASNEKSSQSNLSEKQIGIDNRGNKYVIIRNPTNTVVMSNSPEPCKIQQQRVPVTSDSCEMGSQRKQRQKKQSPLTVQIATPAKSPLPVIPPLPVTSPQNIISTPSNQTQQYFKEQQNISSNMPVGRAVTTKPKGRGRGRPPKNKTETISSTKQTPSNNNKVNANGRRSTGRICEPPRQRSMRSLPETTSSETHQSAMASTTVYTPNQQQTQSVGFMINPEYTSMTMGSSQSIRANNDSYQNQAIGLNPQSASTTTTEISIETSEVSGGGYAVPSLPVPGYPQTYLLCELVGNKYKEVFSKPLYLSPDRTRFLEVPDELVTEAHKKLSDSRREPNPNALKLVSDGTPHILQSRLIEINSENMVNQNEGNSQHDQVLIQKHQQLSVEEQASALLCLQEQLTQEQLAHKQISQDQLVREQLQDQLVQEQLVQEQFVEEQFVQEQFVQEQFVPDQFVQEQFVQEQFVQEQFVQEQFVQEQFVPEQFVQEQFNLQPQQFTLQLARFETGEVIEDAERGQMMVVTAGTHNMILDDKSFFEFTGEKKIDFYNAEKDAYILTPQVISNLLHHYALGHITAVPALNTEIGDHQHEVSISDVIQNADSSTNILEVALDDSGLYTEEQFINTGEILQIETPEGMQLIGTAAENADLIFHHMTKANTNETNVLLNQAPKMSAVEIPSDKSKRRFENKPSTPATLEDCLNVIGVPIQSPNVPTSLELPASVTNPAIVAKTRTPTPGTITMNEIIATGLCHHPDITSLPSMSSNDQELSYEFFPSNTEAHGDKDQVNEESVVTDMGEYAVVTSSASFDDPGR
ncbi:uncharacterized protein LOC129920147 [Episyrphus balteatus]|uniref:uncharacterized protein LOC129920147 n=1 Tax=Episyrphus balteatus TaxID=286459 RepID=UPI002486C42E|nr:uncharacterized protein LOC129920147 [Episyrphus balteatus]XP_055857339.1 uncharacterized protein LOC129920147 [Episyrphus balteatus]